MTRTPAILLPLLFLALATVACGSTARATPTLSPGAALAATLAVITPDATYLVEPTPEPSWTPRVKGEAIAAKNANLRAGPATSYAIIGSVRAGDPLQITGPTCPD